MNSNDCSSIQSSVISIAMYILSMCVHNSYQTLSCHAHRNRHGREADTRPNPVCTYVCMYVCMHATKLFTLQLQSEKKFGVLIAVNWSCLGAAVAKCQFIFGHICRHWKYSEI